MTEHGQTQESWEPCPPGQFEQSAQQHRKQLERRQFLKVTAAGVGLLGAAGLSWLGLRELLPAPLMHISCAEALAYLKNWNNLNKQEQETTLAHGRECAKCRPEFVKRGLLA